MDTNEAGLIFKDEVYRIVGAAMEVFNQLGCGFLEPVYQEALGIELSDRHIVHVPQQRILISYKCRTLEKEYVSDFVCYNEIIVEIKALNAITGVEESQLLNYLKATNHPLGLIINFGAPQLEWQRYANTKKKR